MSFMSNDWDQKLDNQRFEIRSIRHLHLYKRDLKFESRLLKSEFWDLLLAGEDQLKEVPDQKFVFRLLRSYCRVTWQPNSKPVQADMKSEADSSRHKVELLYTTSWWAPRRWWSSNDSFLRTTDSHMRLWSAWIGKTLGYFHNQVSFPPKP